jgi:hypothetical protein
MEHAHPGYLHYYFIERHLQGYLTATQRHAGRPWWYYVPLVLAGALPWTGYLIDAARRVREQPMRLAMWCWFGIGLLFLSIGGSKLVTYALPLFPALALLAGETVARWTPEGAPARRTFAAAFALQTAWMAFLPTLGLLALRFRFGEATSRLWPFLIGCGVASTYAAARAARSRGPGRHTGWLAAGALASVIGLMIVLPTAASWMTSRDLAAALNTGAHLPPRISIVDERIGSLLFYLSPPLRAEATREGLVEASFADAVMRSRIDPDDAIVVVRNSQLERFNRLFPRPPVPSARAGTFTIFQTITLRESLPLR